MPPSSPQLVEQPCLPRAVSWSYLRWCAFFREVEAAIATRPALVALTALEGVPFVGSRVAEAVSSDVIGEIGRQARRAVRNSLASMVPHLELSSVEARACGRHLARQMDWLRQPGLLHALGIQHLAADEVFLANSVTSALLATESTVRIP